MWICLFCIKLEQIKKSNYVVDPYLVDGLVLKCKWIYAG